MPGELRLVWVAWVGRRDYVQVDVTAASVSGIVALHWWYLCGYELETIGVRVGVNRECLVK